MILILEIHTIGGRLEDYIDLEHDVTITMRRIRMGNCTANTLWTALAALLSCEHGVRIRAFSAIGLVQYRADERLRNGLAASKGADWHTAAHPC
jgi:hypothetical protein